MFVPVSIGLDHLPRPHVHGHVADGAALLVEEQVTGLQVGQAARASVSSYWAAAECDSDTPAWAHAHMVRPEQSKPTPGVAPAHT